MQNFVKREKWGYSVWRGTQQIGAGVGMEYFPLHGITLTKAQSRIWRKRGVYKL